MCFHFPSNHLGKHECPHGTFDGVVPAKRLNRFTAALKVERGKTMVSRAQLPEENFTFTYVQASSEVFRFLLATFKSKNKTKWGVINLNNAFIWLNRSKTLLFQSIINTKMMAGEIAQGSWLKSLILGPEQWCSSSVFDLHMTGLG